MKGDLTRDGRIKDTGPLTKKKRDALKIEIANFCKTPRTYREVSREFGISGISAAALLRDDRFDYDREKGTFQKKRKIMAKEILRQETIKKLKKVGVFLQIGGFKYDVLTDPVTVPVCAIWHESEEPTDEEIDSLTKIVQEKLASFNPQRKKGFCAFGANTITFKKEKGQWTFRRMTWVVGPTWFSKPCSLEEIKKAL